MTVGVDDSSNNRLGSSVGERLACHGVRSWSAYLFSAYK